MLPNVDHSIRCKKNFADETLLGLGPTHTHRSRGTDLTPSIQSKVTQHVASVKRKLLGERLLGVNNVT